MIFNALSNVVLHAYLGSRCDTVANISKIPGMPRIGISMIDCEPQVAAYVVEFEVPEVGLDGWRVQGNIGDCHRKIEDYLQTHVYESRASSHCPSLKTLIFQLTDEIVNRL